jgi:hypothetical protein
MCGLPPLPAEGIGQPVLLWKRFQRCRVSFTFDVLSKAVQTSSTFSFAFVGFTPNFGMSMSDFSGEQGDIAFAHCRPRKLGHAA